MVTFKQAVKLFFRRAGDFSGRSTRAEFWWGVLFVNLLNVVTLGVSVIFTFIPMLSLCFRRMQDVGWSGWYFVVMLLVAPMAANIQTIVGLFFMLVYLFSLGLVIYASFKKGQPEKNAWGLPAEEVLAQKYHIENVD